MSFITFIILYCRWLIIIYFAEIFSRPLDHQWTHGMSTTSICFVALFCLLHNARSWIHYFRMHRDMKLLNTWEIMQYELYFWVASKFDWPHYVVATTWTYVRLSMVFAIEVPKHRVQFHPPKQVFLHFTNMEIVRFMRQLHSTTPNR